MPKRIAIPTAGYAYANYLSTEELFVRYRQATEAIERSHYQIIWLLTAGKTVQAVSEVTRYTNEWH